jgi:hypothetical protein
MPRPSALPGSVGYGCCFEMLARSAQFEQIRTCFIFDRRTACNQLQLLLVQFDGLGLVADFLPDDAVVGLLAHDLASMYGPGRNCRVAIS